MWPVSETASLWQWAMHRQDLHELGCLPCRRHRTPVCPEGVRLQQLARQAHEAWVSDQYAGRCVA